MINYNTELNKLVNKIYDKKICEILEKENLDTLKKLSIDDVKKILASSEVYLGSDLENYLNDIIPQGLDEYFLRVEISKLNNLTYPILFNEKREAVKDYSYSNFAKKLWEEHTSKLLINDIYNIFNQDNFTKYINENLESILQNLIDYVIKSKKDNAIIIKTSNNSNLVSTVKEMLKKGELDSSLALTVVDMDKLRAEMIANAVQIDYYDEFDKLEDDLEECLDKFFKYDNDTLLKILIEKENFELVPDLGLVKN